MARFIREGEEREEAQAQIDIWKYVFGFVEMAVLKCAIELGIPEILQSHEGPTTLSELSSAVGSSCSPALLHRIMRFLVRQKIFREVNPAGYVNTPISRLLMKAGSTSMAALVLLETSPAMLASWLRLSARILGKAEPPFVAAHGEDLWGYSAANPGFGKLFDDAMACSARVAVKGIADGYPELLEGLRSVVDVGGGNGTALKMLVEAFPWIRGINLDLPHVVKAAPPCDGVEHVAGDMFSGVPNADAAYLMWVLHDWADEECIRILKNCREAIPKDKGKVIIVEAVIKEEGDGDDDDELEKVGLMLDMVMMAHTVTGKERTAKEWAHVLTEAGFVRHTIKRIAGVHQSVIEAFP